MSKLTFHRTSSHSGDLAAAYGCLDSRSGGRAGLGRQMSDGESLRRGGVARTTPSSDTVQVGRWRRPVERAPGLEGVLERCHWWLPWDRDSWEVASPPRVSRPGSRRTTRPLPSRRLEPLVLGSAQAGRRRSKAQLPAHQCRPARSRCSPAFTLRMSSVRCRPGCSRWKRGS